MQGAGTVAALSTDIAQWAEPFVSHILPQSGGMPGLSGGGVPAAPPGMPAPQDTSGGNFQAVDNKTFKESPLDRQSVPEQATNQNPEQSAQRDIQQTALRQPDKIDPTDAAKEKPSTSASPPSTSAPSPSSGGSS